MTGEDVAVLSSTQVQSSVRLLHGFNTVKSLEKMPSVIIWCLCVCVCVVVVVVVVVVVAVVVLDLFVVAFVHARKKDRI